MKNVSKKVMAGLLSVCLVGALAGCNTSDKPSTSTSNENTNFNTQVVATLDGVDITRETVGEALVSAEKTAISTYMQNQLLETFFKDVTVTEEEVNLQLALIKKQVGEDNWSMYLAYYGGGSEENFLKVVEQNLKQEKMIAEKTATLEITDADLQAKYNEDSDACDIAILNVLFLDTEEDLATATDMVKSGKTLNEIATAMELTVSENEHTYFSMAGWNKKFSEASVGELMYTSAESGNFVVGEVVSLNRGVSNTIVKDDMILNMKSEKGFELLEAEYTEFLKSKTATIMGNDFSLYTEPDTTNTEGTLPQE